MDRFLIARVAPALMLGMAALPAGGQDLIDPDRPYDCTLDNVAGVFGFNEDTLEGGARGEPLATIGLLELRTDGTAAIQEDSFEELGGEAVQGNVVEGEWSIEPNCFGFIDLPRFRLPSGDRTEVDFAFVAVDNGTELLLVRNNPLEEADAKLLSRR